MAAIRMGHWRCCGSSSGSGVGGANHEAARCTARTAWQKQQRARSPIVRATTGADGSGVAGEPAAVERSTPAAAAAATSSSSSSRRGVLRAAAVAAAAAGIAALPLPLPLPLLPQAAVAGQLVDEAAAAAVFASAAPSVAALVQFTVRPGGAEAYEPLGSAIVFDAYGHLVTNYHVVSRYVLDRTGAAGVKAVFEVPSSGGSDGSTTTVALPAAIIGTDASRDLAVLAVDAAALPPGARPLPVVSSSALKVGQTVFSLGARYGDGALATMSSGVVSGLGRAIPAPTGVRIYGVLQTDAAVNSSNSGGALLDSAGRLVGLNTAPFLRQTEGRGSGVGFALPSDTLLEVVPNLIIYGSAAARGVRGATQSQAAAAGASS